MFLSRKFFYKQHEAWIEAEVGKQGEAAWREKDGEKQRQGKASKDHGTTSFPASGGGIAWATLILESSLISLDWEQTPKSN